MILCLETATATCSVALNDGNKTLALRECNGQNSHSEKITIFIKEVMDEVGIGYDQLDAVAVSRGPGSYTGLRIGVSTAKGVCYAAELPLLAVDTLQAMAYGMRDRLEAELQPNDVLVPMIDARRMEVYCAVFDAEMNRLQDTQAVVFGTESGKFSVSTSRFWLFGDGAPKLHSLFDSDDQIRIIDGFTPSAAYMAALSDQALKAGDFVDVAYFEPFYLKDFVAGKPHVKGI
jgi:tRNA threonylcarbamoyladenosine biosynthesis protein TsaB